MTASLSGPGARDALCAQHREGLCAKAHPSLEERLPLWGHVWPSCLFSLDGGVEQLSTLHLHCTSGADQSEVICSTQRWAGRQEGSAGRGTSHTSMVT